MRVMMNNWDVRGGVSDFWHYIRAPRPHRWAFWTATIAVSVVPVAMVELRICVVIISSAA